MFFALYFTIMKLNLNCVGKYGCSTEIDCCVDVKPRLGISHIIALLIYLVQTADKRCLHTQVL